MENYTTEEDRLRYLAGLYDGEGSFSIQVQEKGRTLNFSPKMSMSLTYGHEGPFGMLVQEFGGSVYPATTDNGFRWSLGTRRDIVVAAQRIQPYLLLKDTVVDRFIYALSLFPENSRKGIDLYHGNRGWSTEDEIIVAAVALTLNPGTGVRIQKNLDKLNRICIERSAKMEDVLEKLEGEFLCQIL